MKIVTNPTGRLAVVSVVMVAAIVTALIIKDWFTLNGDEEPSETLLKSNVSEIARDRPYLVPTVKLWKLFAKGSGYCKSFKVQ